MFLQLLESPWIPVRFSSRRLRQEAAAVLLVLAMFVLVLVAFAAIGGAFDGLIPSTSGWPAFRDWASEPGSNAASLERRARFAEIIRSPYADCYRHAYDAFRDAFTKEHEMLRLPESAVRWTDDDEWMRAQTMAAEAERMREEATSIYFTAATACEGM